MQKLKSKRLTTTLREDILKELKVAAIENDSSVSAIIEFLWEKNKEEIKHNGIGLGGKRC